MAEHVAADLIWFIFYPSFLNGLIIVCPNLYLFSFECVIILRLEFHVVTVKTVSLIIVQNVLHCDVRFCLLLLNR